MVVGTLPCFCTLCPTLSRSLSKLIRPLFLLIFFLLPYYWISVVCSLDNGLGLVPPMGWNSWNIFHCDVHEDQIKAQARALANLLPLGYNHLNLDDCWMSQNRTADGKYVSDPLRFPSGMKHLGEYLHKLGLKFGIYTSAGNMTCAGFPGSLHHEDVDAQTFAEWGVDYLKYDNCYGQGISGILRYTKMRDALNATGRPIFYSLCQWGVEDSWQWAPAVANAWRTTGDIKPTWQSIRHNFWASQQHADRGAGGRGSGSMTIPSYNRAWLDPDLLEVGNAGLTMAENRAHFALWCLAKAPLLLSTDLTKMSSDVYNVISNPHLIHINQDPLSPQAVCFVGCSAREPWTILATTTTAGLSVGHNHDGISNDNIFSVVVLVVNWSDDELDLKYFSASTVGVVPTPSQIVTVQDLWSNSNIEYKNNLDQIPLPVLPPHDCAVYQITVAEQHQWQGHLSAHHVVENQ